MNENQELLLQNIDAIKLTAFDDLAFQQINEYQSNHGFNGKYSTYMDSVQNKLAELRMNIVDLLGNDFEGIVKSTSNINDPEAFVKSYCTLDGKTVAKNAIERFDWNTITDAVRENVANAIENDFFNEREPEVHNVIIEYLINHFSELSILKFDTTDVEPVGEKISDILDERGISTEEKANVEDIGKELVASYDDAVDEDGIYADVIDTFQENYGLNINYSHTDLGDDLIKERIRKATQHAVMSGKNALISLANNSKALEKEIDDCGLEDADQLLYHELDDYEGVAYRATHQAIENEDLGDIADDLRNAYVSWMADTNWDGKEIARKDALDSLNGEYPGDRIFRVDEDILTDMVAELTAK